MPPSFEQCLEQYRDQHLAARNLAAETRREYLNDLAHLIAFLTNGCNLTSPARVEKRHLEAFLAALDRRGLRGPSRRRKVPPPSPSSATALSGKPSARCQARRSRRRPLPRS